MLQRCRNPKNKDYKNYGGRGITVCKRWLQYANFLVDMGRRPPKMTLERRNNNKGYIPSNCYWATREEQTRNRRSTVRLVYQGVTKTLREWAMTLDIDYYTLWIRLKRGWTVDQVLGTPKKLYRGK